MTRLAALVALATAFASPQDQVVDRGTFTISRQGVVIGRETFVLRHGTTSTGAPGLVLTSSAMYPPEHAQRHLTVQAEYALDSTIVQLQLDEAVAQQRFFARFAGRRATVRIVTAATESAREYPLSGPMLVAHDSLFALYALRRGAIDSLTIFNPTSGQRAKALPTAGATDTATVGGTKRILKHVILGEGEDARHLWYDESGYLTAIEIPRLGLKAQR